MMFYVRRGRGRNSFIANNPISSSELDRHDSAIVTLGNKSKPCYRIKVIVLLRPLFEIACSGIFFPSCVLWMYVIAVAFSCGVVGQFFLRDVSPESEAL